MIVKRFEVLSLRLGDFSQAETAALLAAGFVQTADYADRCGAAQAHLLIFDRTAGRTWEQKVWPCSQSHEGRSIGVWGL